MSNKDQPSLTDLVYFLFGVVLILLSNIKSVATCSAVAKTLEVMGAGLAGYPGVRVLLFMKTFVTEDFWRERIDRMFQPQPPRVRPRDADLPSLILTDVEGCITPADRSLVDLRKMQRLRSYCEFVKSEAGRGFPPVVLYTGRAQAYVELLAQSLGMINKALDIPFVIENGAALYFPYAKKTTPLVSPEQKDLIQTIRSKLVLVDALRENEFEPKAYMVTINPRPGQDIALLREAVEQHLSSAGRLSELTINSTASAVDITPKGVDKLTGLTKALEEIQKLRGGQCDFTSAVALGDTASDLPVLKKVVSAYCPEFSVEPEVRNFVLDSFGKDHVIPKHDIDFVCGAIEHACSLRLI